MTTYYIATTGNDGNAGTLVNPWATFAHANGVVAAGDTVLVQMGNYSETVSLTNGGTSGNPVTYKSIARFGASIVSTSAIASAVSITGPYITFDGFDIQAPNFGGVVQFQVGCGGSVLTRCAIHNAARSPFVAGGGVNAPASLAGSIVVDRNIIYDIGYAGGGNGIHGCYLSSNLGGLSTGKITNNIIFNIPSGSGVQLWGNPQGWDVTNNTIFNCSQFSVIMGPAATGETLANIRVTSNISRDCTWSIGNTDNGVGQGTYGGTLLVANNLDFNCTNTLASHINVNQAAPSAFTVTGNVTTDPQLVNYQSNGSGDYRLKTGSPAIDTGTLTAAPFYDFTGVSRPQGSGIDMGAFEYVPVVIGNKGGLSLIGA